MTGYAGTLITTETEIDLASEELEGEVVRNVGI